MREAGCGKRDAGTASGERASSPRAAAHPASRFAHPALIALLLLIVYIATLAPGITFWDPSEFVAAVHVLGIPHPPGTPLFVLVARVWSDVLGWLPTAPATNLFSAACTAAAGGALAIFLARSTGWRLGACAAALCAGAMSTVWLNATETEVYAASLLLAMAMLLAAQRASESGDSRWIMLTAYTFGLAVPLHLSALVAAPAAIVLAVQRDGGRTASSIRWRDATLLTGAFIVTVGVGLARWPIVVAGAIVMVASVWLRASRTDRETTWAAGATADAGGMRAPTSLSTALLTAAALLIAFSALLYLPIRASHHPLINEGDPVTWTALWDVIGRRQYGAHGLWPRQAPLWAQFANVFEYADWQVALGLAPGVEPSWIRTPITVLFTLLGVVGCMAHRARERRSWRAFVVLILCASAGLVVYMNFKAGASFGYGVLPANLPHEARDRDYFFTLGFWTWGAWAGIGAAVLASRITRRGAASIGVCVAALPIALNWSAVNRRHMPEATIPYLSASAFLWSTPPDAVLVTGGDNDSFPLWYLQAVERARPDVTVVVSPLLPVEWYRAQLAHRHGLLDSADVAAPVYAEREVLGRIVRGARRLGRPLAVTLTAGETRREALGGEWTLHGTVFVNAETASGVRTRALDALVDTAAASAFVRSFRWTTADTLRRESIDPAPAVFAEVLACPAYALSTVGIAAQPDSLDSPCKFR
ncbi:MAG TPA: DUF2723 domain-containing protein [Gemmatimonadaceae bacterium]|nr:DUF2723 domain-containing protein [Gemmatimonadaceae bacterium]